MLICFVYSQALPLDVLDVLTLRSKLTPFDMGKCLRRVKLWVCLPAIASTTCSYDVLIARSVLFFVQLLVRAMP